MPTKIHSKAILTLSQLLLMGMLGGVFGLSWSSGRRCSVQQFWRWCLPQELLHQVLLSVLAVRRGRLYFVSSHHNHAPSLCLE